MAKPLAKLVKLLTPKRRWAQFSLATMLAVVTVMCVWLALHVNAANRQRTAVTAVKKVGGTCFYDYELDVKGRTIYPNPAPPGPAWLRDSLGIDHLADVVAVSLQDNAVWPPALKHVCKLPKLTCLGILWGDQPLNEEEIEAVNSLVSIHELSVFRGSDPLFDAAATLPNLEVLTVGGGATSEQFLRYVGRMTKLRRLTVVAVHVGDTGLAHLARLDRLAELRLGYNMITDAGLVHLRKRTTLKRLCLELNPITDAGLVHLRELTDLRELYVGGTQVTDTGVAQLQKELPNCKIDKLLLSQSGVVW